MLLKDVKNFLNTLKNYPPGLSILDNFDGLPSGEITEIVGVSGSGKTMFLHQLSVANFLDGDLNKFVLYLDSDFTFDSNKVKKLVEYFGLTENILKNILIYQPTDLSSFKKALKSVNLKQVKLIIIDSINNILHEDVIDEPPEDEYRVLKKIFEFGNFLRKIVLNFPHIAISLANQVRYSPIKLDKRFEAENKFYGGWSGNYWIDEGYAPSLGSYWEEFIDNRILLKNIRGGLKAIYIDFSSTWPETMETIKLVNGVIFKY